MPPPSMDAKIPSHLDVGCVLRELGVPVSNPVESSSITSLLKEVIIMVHFRDKVSESFSVTDNTLRLPVFNKVKSLKVFQHDVRCKY
jgi:hypothetical protein